MRLATAKPHSVAPKPVADPPQTGELRSLALLLDLSLDGRPEQVQDLGDDDHRGHVMGADGLEDDPRIA